MFDVSRRLPPVLTLAAVLALGGCASSSDLKIPLDAFAASAKTNQTVLQKYDAILDNALLETNINLALTKQNSVLHDATDCGPGSKSCHLYVLVKNNGTKLPLYTVPTDPLARLIMAGIVEYANNLQTIANIDSQSDVENATTAAIANIKQLATDVDSGAKSIGRSTDLAKKVAKYQSVVSDTTTFLLSQYLEKRKLQALRTATQTMDTVFAEMMDLCKASIAAGADEQNKRLADTFQGADTDYHFDTTSRSKLDALRAAATAYDASLSVDPQSTFDDLKNTHADLAAALKSDKPNFETFWETLQRAIANANKILIVIGEYKTDSASSTK
jgi:hypothetical protein